MKSFIPLFCLIYLCTLSYGQLPSDSFGTSGTQKLNIEWKASYSGESDFVHEKTLLKNLFELITGKNTFNLRRPLAVTVDERQQIVILDQGNRVIVLGDSSQGKFKVHGTFPSLVSACLDNSGNIYFTDSKLEKIFIRSAKSETIKVLNDSLHLNRPTGIAFSDVTKTLWVVETSAHQISQLDLFGNVISRTGQRGTTHGLFNFPTHIWIDAEGSIYIVDAMNFRIQILNAKGEFVSTFGEAGDGSGYLARPKGIACDSYGNIYICDALFHTIQIFDSQGNYLDRFGQQGQKDGNFWMPNGIFIDSKNNIFVADSYNKRIQVFKANKCLNTE